MMVVILGLLPQGWQLIGLLIVNMYFVMPKKASQASVQSLLLAFLATTLYQYKKGHRTGSRSAARFVKILVTD
jgi:hypothetical protein